jgi:thiol:disulfide interchange protein DsbG
MRFVRRTRALSAALALSLGLSALTLVACSGKEEAAKPAAIATAQAYDVVAKEGRGFTVGAMMSANTVYVLFDPQCPHCSHLWEQSQGLLGKVKFVWLPVAFISPKSAPQGAALLAAADPAKAMAAHEASILGGTGGTAASSDVPEELAAAIKKNTELLNRMGADSVPFIVARNASTGQVVTNAGAMETSVLAQFIGLN